MNFAQQVKGWNQSIAGFFHFVAGKLSSFTRLSAGEQVSYVAIMAGLLFILVSVVLFLV
ncbi:TPA: hypothetical protein HA242_07375 [Candidatus Woesearchaeota archaeon]|nr:hypothetical protein [Candidatus Woesearchaeota archaeon]HIH13517.1 hypothetical protein [Candidatus Woesearchaeota archaeon]